MNPCRGSGACGRCSSSSLRCAGNRPRLLDVYDLARMLNTIVPSRWTDLIAEGIAALAQRT